MSENIIEVRNLSKKFSNHHAVRGISFDLKRGEIKGILGANGAGKSTTITMLLGLLTPTSGSIKILDTDITKNRYKVLNRINFSSPYVDLPKKLTVKQNLYVYGMLYGVADLNKKINSIAKELGFENLLGFRKFGIGAEIVSEVVANCFGQLKAAPIRIGMPDHPTPSSRGLVPGIYPDAVRILREAGQTLGIAQDKIETAVAELISQRQGLPVDVPDPFFKGPF